MQSNGSTPKPEIDSGNNLSSFPTPLHLIAKPFSKERNGFGRIHSGTPFCRPHMSPAKPLAASRMAKDTLLKWDVIRKINCVAQ